MSEDDPIKDAIKGAMGWGLPKFNWFYIMGDSLRDKGASLFSGGAGHGSWGLGSSTTFGEKIKTCAAFIFVGVPVLYGGGSGIIDSASGDTLNPFKSGASAFLGSYHFTSDMVDGFTKDEKGKSSTSFGTKSTKVVMGGYFGVVSFGGAFVGNVGTTTVTHIVWPVSKFAWNHAIVPAASWVGDHIPDTKSSDTPATMPPAAKPKLPQTKMNISYRVNHNGLG